jgi:hypothetical protein
MSRLEAIGESLSRRPTALALIGLGSVGRELDRLDRFSDLDFFVIVAPGSKSQYLEGLGWLEDVAPIAYTYRNTPDGFKVLYQDGVFCEFAIFEEEELERATFAPGRVVWKAEGVEDAIAIPTRVDEAQPRSAEWLMGEALTNLYVGLSRDHRGERLAAIRLIQGEAVDRVLELAEGRHAPGPALRRDPFNRERRHELRYPDMAQLLPDFLQGYRKNRESARALLSFLEEHFELNEAMKRVLLELCEGDGDSAEG